MQNFYKNKKILITGSSGFVGSWLSTALYEMGASLYGISLKPNTSPSLFKLLNLENKINQKYIDICEFNKLSVTGFPKTSKLPNCGPIVSNVAPNFLAAATKDSAL